MLSLSILAAACLASWCLAAWATAAAARRVGSPRGRFAVALTTVVALQGIYLLANAVAAAIATRLPGGPTLARAAIGVASIAFVLGNASAAFGVAFRLPFRRSLAPLGAFIAAQVVMAAFAYGVLRPRLVESFFATASMSPTILPTDRFFADKLLTPRRGDVIVYHVAPRAPGQPAAAYCKRLLGLPGERLCIANGGLTVDGKAVALPPTFAGRLHATPAAYAAPRHAEGEPFTLGPDDYFVVGDDVAHSADSRLDPPVHRAAIVGVVDALYWPPPRVRIFR